MTCPRSSNNRGPSPHEVHPYEFATNRTFDLFFRVVKRALMILAAIVIVGIILIIILSHI